MPARHALWRAHAHESSPCHVARRSNYGTGCYQRFGSFYESFATSTALDLANTSMAWLPTGSGYLCTSGFQPFVPPSAAATALTMTDDSEVIVN